MDLKDLEREELFELVDVLGDKLGKSIRQECILILRVKGLERALDASGKEDFWERRAGQLVLEARGWEETAESIQKELDEARKDLKLAKDQWREYTERTEKRIADLNDANGSLAAAGKSHLKEAEGWQGRYSDAERRLDIVMRECMGFEEKIKELEAQLRDAKMLHTADVEVINNLRLTLEDQRTCLATRDMDVRRLERELRENRASVMNELSGMIQKAVEAEREACMALLRDAALKCADVTNANALMGFVNIIKGRGK